MFETIVNGLGLLSACGSAVHPAFALDGRDDYIAEIQVVFARESRKLPEGQGWELVEKSASGKSANLNKVSG